MNRQRENAGQNIGRPADRAEREIGDGEQNAEKGRPADQEDFGKPGGLDIKFYPVF
jgi:hypothetical protein